MASITAAAGGGNWTTGTTWTGGVAPTAADDAFLDAGSGNVTIDSGAVCRSINCTGYTGTLTHNAITFNIGDATAGASNVALLFVAGMTYTLVNATTSAISFISTSATVQTVNFASKTTGNPTFNAASGGSWQYTGTHNTGTGARVTFTKGTLDINGQTCSWGLFLSSNNNTRSFTLGASAITITGTGASWDFGDSANLTFSGTSSTITFTGTDLRFVPAGKTFGTLIFSGAGGCQINNTSQSYAFSCTNLTRTGSTAKTDSLTIAGTGTFTITGTFTCNGNSVINRVLVKSITVGTARTITAATVTVTNSDFQDITGAGAGSWDLSAITGNSGDCGGNSGITFTTAATQTWSGTSGGNWSANAWTSRVPLPQDDVVINNAFSASQTVTTDMPRLGKSIDWTGATGSPTWSFVNPAPTIYGSITLISGMTISGTSATTLAGRSSFTLTSAGRTYTQAITITAPSGTYTLNDAFSNGGNGAFTLNNGTFNANNFAVTCLNFASSNSNIRTLTMGSGTWTTVGTTGTVFNLATTTNLTFTANTATIVISGTSTGLRMFAGGGKAYGTFTYTVAGSTGGLDITGSNTFTTINFSDASNARTLRFTAATTTTVTNFNVNGTSGKNMTVTSITAATHTLTSSAQQSVDFLTLSYSIVDASPAWYAGANSTDSGNNTNWIFTAPSTDNAIFFGTNF